MGDPADLPASVPRQRGPGFATTSVLLHALRTLLRPIVRLSLSQGVRHQQMVEVLKAVYLDVAHEELSRDGGRPPSASLVSIATGLHRKDVARLSMESIPQPEDHDAVEARVFTRWLSEPGCLDASGKPRSLPRVATGNEMSFERLARGVTSDVHPRSVLAALVHLGLAELDTDDHVRLLVERFVPAGDADRMLGFLRDNGHDHLAAAVHNFQGRLPPLLEQSLHAEGLSDASVDRLHTEAREVWARLVRECAPLAERLMARDAARMAAQPELARRVRIGMYFNAGPEEAGPKGDPES